ncbi:MAG: hypothetical protein RL701_6218 [Pseudomonadota bacterium]
MLLLWRVDAVRARPNLELNYLAPPDCPDRAYLLHGIERLSADHVILAANTRVSAEVTVEGTEFALLVEWSGAAGSGSRYMAAESCVAAVDTAAWLIVLALTRDPNSAAALATESAGDASDTPLHFELGVGAVLDVAALPRAGLGAAARVGLVVAHFHIDVSGVYLPPQTLRVAGVEGELDLFELGIAGCHLSALGTFLLGPCLRAAVGSLAAASFSTPAPSSGSGRYQSLSGGLEARVHLLEAIWLAADLAIIWNQRRPNFVLAGFGRLYEPVQLGFRAQFSLVVAIQ